MRPTPNSMAMGGMVGLGWIRLDWVGLGWTRLEKVRLVGRVGRAGGTGIAVSRCEKSVRKLNKVKSQGFFGDIFSFRKSRTGGEKAENGGKMMETADRHVLGSNVFMPAKIDRLKGQKWDRTRLLIPDPTIYVKRAVGVDFVRFGRFCGCHI